MFIVDNPDGANWERLYNLIRKLSMDKSPDKNPVALKWIKNAKAERGITESYVTTQIGKVVHKKKYKFHS